MAMGKLPARLPRWPPSSRQRPWTCRLKISGDCSAATTLSARCIDDTERQMENRETPTHEMRKSSNPPHSDEFDRLWIRDPRWKAQHVFTKSRQTPIELINKGANMKITRRESLSMLVPLLRLPG